MKAQIDSGMIIGSKANCQKEEQKNEQNNKLPPLKHFGKSKMGKTIKMSGLNSSSRMRIFTEKRVH